MTATTAPWLAWRRYSTGTTPAPRSARANPVLPVGKHPRCRPLAVRLHPAEVILDGAGAQAPRRATPPLERLDTELDMAQMAAGSASCKEIAAASSRAHRRSRSMAAACPTSGRPNRVAGEVSAVLLQHRGCVVLGIERDRVHEDVAPDASFQAFSTRARLPRWCAEAVAALRVHEW